MQIVADKSCHNIRGVGILIPVKRTTLCQKAVTYIDVPLLPELRTFNGTGGGHCCTRPSCEHIFLEQFTTSRKMNLSQEQAAQSANGSENATFKLIDLSSEPAGIAVKVVAYCIMLTASLTGNTLVLMILYKNTSNQPRTPSNIFIANMACADILVTLSNVTMHIKYLVEGHEWLVGRELGIVLCKLYHFIWPLSIVVSTLSMSCILSRGSLPPRVPSVKARYNASRVSCSYRDDLDRCRSTFKSFAFSCNIPERLIWTLLFSFLRKRLSLV